VAEKFDILLEENTGDKRAGEYLNLTRIHKISRSHSLRGLKGVGLRPLAC
jgi:hypothetical protein